MVIRSIHAHCKIVTVLLSSQNPYHYITYNKWWRRIVYRRQIQCKETDTHLLTLYIRSKESNVNSLATKYYQTLTDRSSVPRLKHISKTNKELMISNEGERDGNKISTGNINIYQHLKGKQYLQKIYV